MATATVDDLMKAVNEMRDHNNKALKEVAKFGETTGETKAAVEAANAQITKLEGDLKAERDKTEEKLAEYEDRLNRNNSGGRGHVIDEETRIRYAVWQSGIQDKLVDPADVDLEFVQGYTKAFRNWLRTGRIGNELSVVSDPDGGYWVDPDTSGRVATPSSSFPPKGKSYSMSAQLAA